MVKQICKFCGSRRIHIEGNRVRCQSCGNTYSLVGTRQTYEKKKDCVITKSTNNQDNKESISFGTYFFFIICAFFGFFFTLFIPLMASILEESEFNSGLWFFFFIGLILDYIAFSIFKIICKENKEHSEKTAVKLVIKHNLPMDQLKNICYDTLDDMEWVIKEEKGKIIKGKSNRMDQWLNFELSLGTRELNVEVSLRKGQFFDIFNVRGKALDEFKETFNILKED